MTTPTYATAQLDEIHVTPTEATALSDATRLDGLKSFKHTVTQTLEELKLLNQGDNWRRQVPTDRAGSGSLEGYVVKDSTVQATIKTAIETGAPIYVTAIDNKAAAVGQQKGTRYCFYIESSEKPREAGNTITFNYPLKQHGPPVAVMAV